MDMTCVFKGNDWFQLGEDFSSDILDDVQALINPSSKVDNVLTWL